MIRRLRRLHRVMFFILAAALPVGVSLAVLARPAEHWDEKGFGSITHASVFEQPEGLTFETFTVTGRNTLPFPVSIEFSTGENTHEWIAVAPLEEPNIADLWVMATSEDFGERSSESATLPQNIHLVGALNSLERVTYRWPEGANRMILYSMAKATVVGEIDLGAALAREEVR